MNFWSVVQGGMSQNIEEIKKLPFDAAGKTGITGFPNEQARMINHSLFIAYAPTEDPQVAVSVVIPGSNSEKHCCSRYIRNFRVLEYSSKEIKKKEGSL